MTRSTRADLVAAATLAVGAALLRLGKRLSKGHSQ